MIWPILSPNEVRHAANTLPRVELAHLPTPLDEVRRFASRIGNVRVFIKRDDCTGLLMGGNKARHNEFLMGDALASGCDMFVWGASVQSNNCRQTAAACARLGLECRLFLSTTNASTEPQGNLLLDYLVGAHVEFTSATLGRELDAFLAEKAEHYRGRGRKPYFWNRARALPRAAVSYTVCMAEIVEQMHTLGLPIDAVYVCSAGSTGSGVALGKSLLGLKCPVRSICPMKWPWDTRAELAENANKAAELMGLPHRLTPDEIDCTEDFIGPGYAVTSPEGHEALKLLATTEGILLDPVYSAKAMAAVIADIRAGRIRLGANVVFIHTGGTPAIFAEREKVLME